MSAILKLDFPKKKSITFLGSKLSKLHKKDPILHVTTIFSLKQGETRTNSAFIPHPLRKRKKKHNCQPHQIYFKYTLSFKRKWKVDLLPTNYSEAYFYTFLIYWKCKLTKSCNVSFFMSWGRGHFNFIFRCWFQIL